MPFSDWIDHTSRVMPVDSDRIVEVEINEGPVSKTHLSAGPAQQFAWTQGTGIIRYRVELTADEIHEEEEWERLSRAAETG